MSFRKHTQLAISTHSQNIPIFFQRKKILLSRQLLFLAFEMKRQNRQKKAFRRHSLGTVAEEYEISRRGYHVKSTSNPTTPMYDWHLGIMHS